MDNRITLDEIEVLAQNYIEGQSLLRGLYLILKSLGWAGTGEQVAEAIPHFSNVFKLVDLQETLEHLGYTLKTLKIKRESIDKRLLPVLFISEDQLVSVFEKDEEGEHLIRVDEFGGEQVLEYTNLFDGLLCIVHEKTEDSAKNTWMKRVFFTRRVQFIQLLIQGLIANTLILTSPFFIMAVYDGVLKTQSLQMLLEFLTGILLSLSFYWVFQKRQKKLVASICADSIEKVDENILAQLLKLPANYTEVSSVPTQISRVQDYDKINEMFSTQILGTLVEIPFVLLFLAALYAFAGWMILIPLASIAAFALLSGFQYLMMRWLRQRDINEDVGWRSFLIESVQKILPIKYAHFENAWYRRFREISAKTIYRRYRQSFHGQIIEAIADGLVLCTSLSVLAFGVFLVSHGELSVGGLIASLIIVTRIISPVRKFFINIGQIKQFREMLQQINRLAGLNQEEFSNRGDAPILQGKIEFNQVGLRYTADRDPALFGINFTAMPGELVILTGPNGSGKSTVLKLLLRLYQQQVGSITVDDQDIRQIPHNLLRKSVAYAAQVPQFFYGTIAQNLRLANPVASDEALEEVCRQAFVLDDIKQMPKGFETRIRDNDIEQLPASFRQRLQLARTLLIDAPIMLLDEPASHLDGNHDEKFIALLKSLHGKRTIIMSSHRPSHFGLADKVLFLENGQIKKIERPRQNQLKVS